MSDRFTAPTTVHLSGYADCHLRDHERIKELEAELAAASRQLWDKDDAITKLHRRISELEGALAESQEVIRQNAVDFAIANGAIANLQHALGESEKLRTAMVAENTWKSDDYDRLRTEFTKLILELGESRKKMEELEDRLNDIHIHNLERD